MPDLTRPKKITLGEMWASGSPEPNKYDDGTGQDTQPDQRETDEQRVSIHRVALPSGWVRLIEAQVRFSLLDTDQRARFDLNARTKQPRPAPPLGCQRTPPNL
jgi:hypothetical protein